MVPNKNEVRSLTAAIKASKAMTLRLERMLARKLHGPGQMRSKVQAGAEVMAWWNELAKDRPLSSCRAWSEAREGHYQARLASGAWDTDKIAERIRNLQPYIFEKKWFCLPWILKSQENLLKVLEGNYSFDKDRDTKRPGINIEDTSRQADELFLESDEEPE